MWQGVESALGGRRSARLKQRVRSGVSRKVSAEA
jgi:hypothetical protein